MTQNDSGRENGHDGIEVEKRTRRALEEPLSVVDLNGTPLDGTESIVRVISHTGGDYRVDVRDGRCSCPDAKHRDPDGGCKHVRRARIATGHTPVATDTLRACDVDRNLADHVDGSPEVVATDGGAVRPAGRSRVPVAGGVLVFESRELGKELVGFEQVEDWDGIRSALVARGHGVGAIHQLPVFDGSR